MTRCSRDQDVRRTFCAEPCTLWLASWLCQSRCSGPLCATPLAMRLRPGLTQAARGGVNEHGRDGETALDRTEKHRHDGRDGNCGHLLSDRREEGAQVKRIPTDTAATPNPCRSPLGEACGPSSPAASITAVHGAPAGHPAPGPEALPAPLATAGLQLADAVHQVERLEERRRHGHGTEDPGAAVSSSSRRPARRRPGRPGRR